ncbi:hypothetical protein MLD52_16095 [Puniceicoccaceae bacterium K14]|nr:hypothetical protein [Puniceicoccaceae bacterium K14]
MEKKTMKLFLSLFALLISTSLYSEINEEVKKLFFEEFDKKPIEEKRKAYEIALKELKESKIEYPEYEHDHMHCILLWEKYRSMKALRNALDKIILESSEKYSKELVDRLEEGVLAPQDS